ncbi:MAG TPA: hypothetical protein DD377_03735 [Firmicutes bacterium]|nr:hypothetical protein [Bacillota bacterium]HBM70459.1 hypothetical protein [Bacillota bacterium]
MGFKLSKRLQAVADFVDPHSFLADIGSDHAHLPIYLVQSKKIEYAQAIENKIGPFIRMKTNIESAGLSSKIFASKSDGISEISNDVDTLSLCGLGGVLTYQILSSNLDKLDNIKTIIVDPHRDLKLVREKVSSLGFYIDDETIIYEDKVYYFIVKFKRGKIDKPYSTKELLLGPKLLIKKEPIFLLWLEEQRKKVSSLLNKGLTKEKRDQALALYRVIVSALK